MNTSLVAHAGLVLCAAAPLLGAQGGFHPPKSMSPDPLWGDLGPCREVQYGHAFGNLALDAVVLYDAGPVVYKAPEVYRAPVWISIAANDVAVYPRSGAPDWVFVAGPAGLSRFTWDGETFVDDSRNFPESIWIDAQVVGVANLENQGGKDLYGLDATRTKVILCRAVSTVWEASSTVPFTETIQSVVPVQWNGVRFEELAVRTTTRLHIINYQSELLATFVISTGSDRPIQVVDIPGTTRQAVIVPSAYGAAECLKVYGMEGEIQTLPTALMNTVGLSSGDLDLDLDPDLVLSHRSAPTLEVFEGGLLGQLLHFEENLTLGDIFIDDWDHNSWNEALPGVADFDRDHDLDVLFPLAVSNRVDLFSNEAIDDVLFMCEPTSGSMTLGPTGEGVFHLSLLVAPEATQGPWTDIETVVWRQLRFDYLLQPTAYLPHAYHSFAGLTHLQFDLPTPYHSWFEDIYHLEVRLVQRVNGVKVDQGPGMTAAVGLRHPLMALAAIEGISHGETLYGITFDVPFPFEFPGTTPPMDPVPFPGGQNPRYEGNDVEYSQMPSGTWGGGSGCLPDIPDSPGGNPPQP